MKVIALTKINRFGCHALHFGLLGIGIIIFTKLKTEWIFLNGVLIVFEVQNRKGQYDLLSTFRQKKQLVIGPIFSIF